jgi:hypothetical protein
MTQERVMAALTRATAQGKTLSRPQVGGKIATAITAHLQTGDGMLKVATVLGVGSGTAVQWIKAELATPVG